MWPTGRGDLPESTVSQSCATGNRVSLNVPMGEVDGKVALVTGAGSGIGRASAGVCAERCTGVVADVVADAAAETEALIREAGGQAACVVADVSSASEVERIVRPTVDQFGALDFVHNNAGVEGAFAGTADYPEDAGIS